MPRDNPIKDFTDSAQEKFEVYATWRPDDYRLLTIVWDDFVYEPITTFLGPDSGIFTPNSFVKDAAGRPKSYVKIDGVIILRHLHQFMDAMGDAPCVDGIEHAFDYGQPDQFPWKVFIANPNSGRQVPDSLLEAYHAIPPHPMLGAEYSPSHIVWRSPFGGQIGSLWTLILVSMSKCRRMCASKCTTLPCRCSPS